MSENIEIDIELSNEQIIELLQVIDRSKTGAKFELKEVTKYTSLELESIIRNYPVIQTALEIKENEIAERLEAKAFNSIMSKEYLGQGDSVFWKTMIESRGKKIGYSSDKSNNNVNVSVNNNYNDMSSDELQSELDKLDGLDNEIVDDTTTFESYLNMLDPSDYDDPDNAEIETSKEPVNRVVKHLKRQDLIEKNRAAKKYNTTTTTNNSKANIQDNNTNNQKSNNISLDSIDIKNNNDTIKTKWHGNPYMKKQ